MFSFSFTQKTTLMLLNKSAPNCHLCHLSLNPNEYVWCTYCRQHFSQLDYCHQCGLTLLPINAQCQHCEIKPPPWNTLYRLGEYRYPLNRIIHQFKQTPKEMIGKPLGIALAKQITTPAQLCIPVPIHPWRRWTRSFNQSTELAHHIAHYHRIAYDPNGFRRQRYTPDQKHLNREQRRHNVQSTFVLNRKHYPGHVAIIDDVITTGNTVKALTLLLKNKGVKHIDIYCVCVTPIEK